MLQMFQNVFNLPLKFASDFYKFLKIILHMKNFTHEKNLKHASTLI